MRVSMSKSSHASGTTAFQHCHLYLMRTPRRSLSASTLFSIASPRPTARPRWRCSATALPHREPFSIGSVICMRPWRAVTSRRLRHACGRLRRRRTLRSAWSESALRHQALRDVSTTDCVPRRVSVPRFRGRSPPSASRHLDPQPLDARPTYLMPPPQDEFYPGRPTAERVHEGRELASALAKPTP